MQSPGTVTPQVKIVNLIIINNDKAGEFLSQHKVIKIAQETPGLNRLEEVINFWAGLSNSLIYYLERKEGDFVY